MGYDIGFLFSGIATGDVIEVETTAMADIVAVMLSSGYAHDSTAPARTSDRDQRERNRAWTPGHLIAAHKLRLGIEPVDGWVITSDEIKGSLDAIHADDNTDQSTPGGWLTWLSFLHRNAAGVVTGPTPVPPRH